MVSAIKAARSELTLIRHAPANPHGRLFGRSDVAADLSDARALAALRAAIGPFDRRVISPARRCAQTAAGLWPAMPAPESDARLWEQDFGGWEGSAWHELPDLGPLPLDALAVQRPPGGESFADTCARIVPALEEIAARGGRIAILAHAGTVRAALAMALGSIGAALAFQVAPLSLTRLTAYDSGKWSIDMVSWTASGGSG